MLRHKRTWKLTHTTFGYLLFRASKKYGAGNFSFEIIEECLPIKEILLSREQYYLDLYDPDYNILKTARSNSRFKHSLTFKDSAISDKCPAW